MFTLRHFCSFRSTNYICSIPKTSPSQPPKKRTTDTCKLKELLNNIWYYICFSIILLLSPFIFTSSFLDASISSFFSLVPQASPVWYTPLVRRSPSPVFRSCMKRSETQSGLYTVYYTDISFLFEIKIMHPRIYYTTRLLPALLLLPLLSPLTYEKEVKHILD